MGILKHIAIASAASVVLAAPVQAAPEYQIKAAILYKFAVFVEWPARSFQSASSPFVACVLGKDPFGHWLQQELGETRVGSHPVQIRHLEDAGAAQSCHTVFVAASEEPRLPQILQPLRQSSALIISDVKDADQFCRAGGMICLVMEGGKVRFQLNSKALEQAGLKVDSRLKRVALSADCGEGK